MKGNTFPKGAGKQGERESQQGGGKQADHQSDQAAKSVSAADASQQGAQGTDGAGGEDRVSVPAQEGTYQGEDDRVRIIAGLGRTETTHSPRKPPGCEKTAIPIIRTINQHSYE